MSEKTTQSLPPGKILAARNVIHKVPELIEETEKRFKTENLDGNWDGKSQCILRKLCCTGVLTKQDKYHSGRGDTRTIYAWNLEAKRELQEYLENLDTLPCEHRVHIKNNRDGSYGCKYCDESRNYPESLIRELMGDE